MADSRRGLKVIVRPSGAGLGRSPAVNPRRYSIGVDFGTESARAVLVDVADGAKCGVEVHDYRNGVIDDAPAGARRRRRPRARLGVAGPERLPGHVPTGRPPAGRSGGHRPRRGHRHRHRLHRLHDAPDDGRWHAAVLPRAVPARPACLGEAVEASRGTARGRRHQPGRPRARATVARPLRRPDLVRVVLPEGAPDPARGTRALPRRGPFGRGGRLGRLAADRDRDPEQLHRRLQGPVGRRRRLPGVGLLRGARAAASGPSSTTRCRARSRRSDGRPAA